MKMIKPILTLMCASITALYILAGGNANAANGADTNRVKFPKSVDSNCNRGRAKLYDECGSQFEIFSKALYEQ